MVRLYRRMATRVRPKVADAIIINSESLRPRSPLPRRRPGQAAPDPGGGGPRPVPPGRPRRRPRTSRALRRHAAVRALRVVAVALQELRGPAARLRAASRSCGTGSSSSSVRGATSPTSPSSGPSRMTRHRRRVVWVGGVPLEETVHFYRAPTSSRTRRTTRPSGCRSSRRWRPGARS